MNFQPEKGLTMKTLRQGDVLLVKVKELPTTGATRLEAEGDVILAFGESTGHAHRIKASNKCRLWDAGAERFLQVMETVALFHEEHATVEIPPGIYRLPNQVEYSPAELRRVSD